MMNLEKELREQPQVLARVLKTNEKALNEAVAAIKARGDISNVIFAARGTSDHACIYAQYLMERYIGIPCGLATSSVITKYDGKLRYPHSLVIGVSQSGMAKDVLAVIERAKESGALTVTVTNNTDSPLASAGDFHLFCDCGPETSIAATKTFTSQMYLLAKLCQLWCGCEKLGADLDRVPGAVKELLDYMPEKVLDHVRRYRFMEGGVFVGRGMTYPIALEGALKSMETNRLRMVGYAISDFQHGPLAQLSNRNVAFVLAAEGPCLDDAKLVLEKLKPTEAETLIITDVDDFDKDCEFILKLPRLGSDSVSPFLFAVTVQLLALQQTKVRGIDPDVSNVLNKITVTK
ncbi:MAG: SIS domain-containing protein [Clostridia bacterium]|nr:SIS domain-containing protein [Clostridia bacterium]